MADDPNKYVARANYTAAELAALAAEAIAQIMATGASYTIDGKTVTRADLKALRDEYQFWQQMASAQSGLQSVNLATRTNA